MGSTQAGRRAGRQGPLPCPHAHQNSAGYTAASSFLPLPFLLPSSLPLMSLRPAAPSGGSPGSTSCCPDVRLRTYLQQQQSNRAAPEHVEPDCRSGTAIPTTPAHVFIHCSTHAPAMLPHGSLATTHVLPTHCGPPYVANVTPHSQCVHFAAPSIHAIHHQLLIGAQLQTPQVKVAASCSTVARNEGCWVRRKVVRM